MCETIRPVLQAFCSSEKVLRFVDGSAAPDTGLWDKAAELGWFALPVPEDFGGLGLGFTELAVLYEEMGRVTAPLPFLTTALAASVIGQGGSSQQKSEWLPRIAAGELPASLRIPGPERDVPLPRLTRQPDNSLLLTGDALEHCLMAKPRASSLWKPFWKMGRRLSS